VAAFKEENTSGYSLSYLLLATNNWAKITEYRKLLDSLPFKLVTLAEKGITTEVGEVGESLEENAKLKAVELSRESGLAALADDSGLEVDVLGGEPGRLSARYAGEGASDKDRIDYLLRRLEGVPPARRVARFRCVIAVATTDGRVGYSFGECAGMISLVPVGTGGFGYDPIFYLPELDRTMAQLSMEEKNRISHRGKAAAKVGSVLEVLGL
jgi:XTP/dITP diphosphohydrolase